MLHTSLYDLLNVKGLANFDMQPAGCDLLNQLFQRRQHEIFRTAAVGRQVDRSRDGIHRAMIATSSRADVQAVDISPAVALLVPLAFPFPNILS